MKLFLRIIFFCLLAPIAYASCQVVDDAGQVINLHQPATRIISLAPDITETLFAIGAGLHIVGTIAGSDYPNEAKSITQVGSYNAIDIEKIIALKPDLIITWDKSFSRQLGMLKDLGIPIYTNSPHRLEDIPKSMIHFGCLSGKVAEGKLTANNFLQALQKLKNQNAQRKKIKVFYQIGTYSFITVNKDSWINEVINLCGGENIFANASLSTPEITWEALVVANPEAIMSDATSPTWKEHWLARDGLQAVEHQTLFNVSPDLLERAGPRILQGAREVCHNLQKVRRQLFSS